MTQTVHTPRPVPGMAAAEMLERLVSIPSPSGEEADAVAFMQAQARADGFTVIDDQVGNFIADSGGDGPMLLFVGHIDTVPGGPEVRREGDVLWGRGSVDAKGAVVAAYCAARQCMDRRIVIVAAVGEEADSRGTHALRLDGEPAMIVNGEPSGWDGFTVAYKGIIRGSFQASGQPVHGGHPAPGALDRCVGWWASVRSALGCGTGFDTIQGRLDALTGGSDGHTDRASGRFQLRIPPGIDPEETVLRIQRRAAQRDVQVDVDEVLDAAAADPRSPLAAAFRSAIRGQGGRPRPLQKTGTSDFNILANRYPGIPMVAYGPGDSSLDHTPDERIDLGELEGAVAVLSAVFRAD